jgi:hypothetical protein
MIEIFGPTYRYGGEILTKPEIIYVSDHHYDEDQHCFHVKTLLENSACDPLEHLVVFDHMNHEDELSEYNTLYLPILLSAECKEFAAKSIVPDWTQKTHNFNFMINKSRPHREFLLMLLEHFDLKNFTYSLCWKTTELSRHRLKQRTANPMYREIIFNTKINIEPRYHLMGQEVIMERGLRYGDVHNSENYARLLKHTVFEPSCVSLITEPSFYERETLKTEKTIMAMYGGTLPIWVGGWGIPQSLRDLGFDVFDDIIDHSYERMSDPYDRAYYAVEKNLDLLRDFDKTKNFIDRNHDRFKHNIKLIEQNVFLTHMIEKIKQYDSKVQRYLLMIAEGFRFRCLADYQLLGELIGGQSNENHDPTESTQRWG